MGINRFIHVCVLLIFLSFSVFGEINFTKEEIEFLNSKKTIKMAVDPDWMPFEKIDEKGKYIGISADLISLIEKKSNIKIELVPTKNWDESIKLSKEGKVDILPFLNKTPARDKWLIFTEPVFSDATVIVTREETPYIDSLSKLGKKVAVFPAGTSLEEKVRKNYPNLDILIVEREEDVFKNILEKKADLTVRSLTVSAYTIRNEGIFNLKISGQIPEYTNEFRIGITGNQEILKNILNKVIATISPEEKEEIVNKHIYIKLEKLVDYEPLKRIILIFSVLGLFMIYKYYSQKKENERTLSLLDALKESKNRYALLSKQSKTFNFETDLEGIIIEVSPLIKNILGYEKDEVINKNFFYDFCLEEEKFSVRKIAREIISQGKTLDNYEFKQVTKDGKIIWILANGICLYNEAKEKIGFSASYMDITERKNIENKLVKSEQDYRLLFENSIEAILVIESGFIKLVNPMTLEIVGYSEEELKNEIFLSFVYEEDRKLVMNFHTERVKGLRDNSPLEFRIRKKDGSIRWVESKGIKILWDNKEATINFVVDITDRKETQDALKESEEKYRLLTEFASDVIWVLNLNKQKFTYVSPTVYLLRGISAKEAINESLEEALTPKSIEIVKIEIEKNLKEFLSDPKNPKYYLTEIEQPRKDGSIVSVEVGTKFRFNKANEIEVVGVSRDIGERKKAQENILYLSYHDQLTSLYNRRFFEEELKRVDTLRNLPISIVMIDVNGLKLANDAFGHLLGDKLLKKASQILKDNFRTDEIIARTGGDEFIVLLPKTSYLDTLTIMERIEKSMEDEKVEHIKLSFAWGIASKNDIIEDFQEIYKKAENQMYEKKVKSKALVRKEAINVIVNSLYEKISEEKFHAQEVEKWARKIAEKLNLNKNEKEILGKACYYHDVGKISIDTLILNKTGKLAEEEWYLVKKHSQIGADIIGSSMENAVLIKPILHHHEHWDGSGYPEGLSGEEIPLLSRIIAVADAFQAMQSDRPYRKSLSTEKTLEIIRNERGKQFDPYIVDTFLSLFD